MGWRFRRSVRLFPGVRLNFSKSGFSASLGVAPFTVNLSPRGAMQTVSLPGSGISFRQHIRSAPADRSEPDTPASPAALTPPAPPPIQGTEIKSLSAHEVSSDGLATLLSLLKEANTERRDIKRLLVEAEEVWSDAATRYEKWKAGFFRRKLFPGRFAKLGERATESEARVSELREQLKQASVQTEIECPPNLADAFEKARQAFVKVCGAKLIWDVVASQKVDKRAERSIAERALTRKPVKFELGRSDVLSYSQDVPLLRNRNGGDLFIYPGFVLYRENDLDFGLIDLRELKVNGGAVRFVESDHAPSDATRVGTTWLRANADGGPDRRYKDNPELPIMEYGVLAFSSSGGLNEEYQVSNAALAQEFGDALGALIKAATDVG